VWKMFNESGPTVALFGLPVSNLTMSEAVEQIADWIESGTKHQVVAANLDFARNARDSDFLHRLICECSMVLPDGAPLLWASRLLRRPLKERVTAVDLVPALAKLSAKRGFGIFLLGSDGQNAEAASQMLRRAHPGVRLVGSYSPPISSLGEMDDEKMLRKIEIANPDILLVAFGNPKQEVWISRNFHRLQVPVAIGIGGSLDIIAGTLKRAPKWVQRLKMEWFYRMSQEPRRLIPRYARDLRALLWHLPIEVVANRLQPERDRDLPLAVHVQGSNRIVQMPEILSGDECLSLIATAATAARLGQILILDLSLTTRLEADGVGSLVEARRIMMVAQKPVWLASLSNPVRNVLLSTALLDVFRVAESTREAIWLSRQGLPHPDRRKRPRLVSGAVRNQARTRTGTGP
jgi:N-acetylglucosaminyldiphosphoundecaprenol N-acetyl-beta-D-mannosaminyltransferase